MAAQKFTVQKIEALISEEIAELKLKLQAVPIEKFVLNHLKVWLSTIGCCHSSNLQVYSSHLLWISLLNAKAAAVIVNRHMCMHANMNCM